jgi:hypothetical protein
MGRPAISSTKLSDTLTMSLCHDGYWLHDYTRRMNLSMRAKTEQDAFVEALTYYQKRLKDVENCYACLQTRVDEFVNQFVEDDGYEYKY